MINEKTQRAAYAKGFTDGHHKFEAEFETLLEVSEGRLREIDKLKQLLLSATNKLSNSKFKISYQEQLGLSPHHWKVDGSPGLYDTNYKCSKCGATDSESADSSYAKPEFGCTGKN